ncbi:hypothetical protein NIES4103_20320 [Nostoc sp. NIES-4103]|nr:hypothetical protein NIES4103_20320 [Nostoc sp. NIES-4103]
MSEKSLSMYQMSLDPPKSPLKRGTLILVSPFLRGVRGNLNVLKITAEYFSDIL